MSLDLYALAAGVALPDDDAQASARADRPGTLGRLDELAVWLAGAQGRWPLQPLQRVRLVAFGSPPATEVSVRAATAATLEEGVALADAEVDAGADLLVLTAPGADGVVATSLIAACLEEEPAVVVARHDDAAWMREVVVVRDLLRRARRTDGDALELLEAIGDGTFAAMTGILVQAGVRRTPVLLDGLATAAAALLADRIAPRAPLWWVAAHVLDHPAHRLALERLSLRPLLDLGLQVDDGTGALLALPLVEAAITG